MNTTPTLELPTWRKEAPSGLSLAAARAMRPEAPIEIVGAKSTQADVDLRRIIRPQVLGRWLSGQVSSMTPTRIETILSGGLAGDFFSQWELFQLMEDTWPRLTKNLNEIKRAVRQMDWRIEPWAEEDAPPTPEADARARLVSNGLWKMRPKLGTDENGFLDTIYDLLDAWGKGTSVIEILWDRRTETGFGEVIVPRATAWVSPQDWLWTTDGAVALRQGKEFTDLPEYKFMVGIARSRTGHPLGTALLRPLAWWWCAANFSASWLLNLAQIFGLPIRWAKYAQGAAPATISALCDMLENMGSTAWAAVPEGTQLELVESSKGAASYPQVEMIDRADKQCDLLVLGQTLTTDVGDSGSRALGDVHEGVREEIITAAAEWCEDVINHQLVTAILELNFGNDDESPEVSAHFRTNEDAKANAERDAILLGAGLEIPKSFLYSRHKIPMPQEGEEVVGAPKPAAPPMLEAPPNGKADTDDDTEDDAEDDTPVAAKAATPAPAKRAQQTIDTIVRMAVADAAGIRSRWLAPLKTQMDRLIRAAKDDSITDDVLIQFASEAARSMPDLFEKLDYKVLARHLEIAMGTAAVEGVKAQIAGKSER